MFALCFQGEILPALLCPVKFFAEKQRSVFIWGVRRLRGWKARMIGRWEAKRLKGWKARMRG